MIRNSILTAVLLNCFALSSALAEDTPPTPKPDLQWIPALSRFADGDGPSVKDGVYSLLGMESPSPQSNSVGFARSHAGAYKSVELTCKVRVLPGAEGGYIALLNTGEFAVRGPSPFIPRMEMPNLKKTFAVGMDVSNTPNQEWFRGPGNIYGHPEREVSLHWDGREIVKRRAQAEFRGKEFVPWALSVHFVLGGAEITVQAGEEKLYDRYFIPSMMPYEFRLGLGAGTGKTNTALDVKDLKMAVKGKAEKSIRPAAFNIFNYVQTTRSQGRFTAEVDLPPSVWAFGRVIMKIHIHGGARWDEWDRCASVGIEPPEGTPLKIVRLITSYKTPCYWEVDVSDFRPLLQGKTKFFLQAGTIYKDKGFLMSVDLDFYPGLPRRHAFQVVPLWNGTVRYGSDDAPFGGFYGDKSVVIDEKTTAARLHLVHTGHSQVGEFTPAPRTVMVNGRAYENVLWREDVYLNPHRPQYGTWKFSRAGWAPGDICHPWLMDVTKLLEPGKPALFQYEPKKYEFGEGRKRPKPKELARANHIVSSYLILYTRPEALVEAPTLRISKVTPDSAAMKAGLKLGDYLFSYDGVRLFSMEDIGRAKKIAQEAEKKTVKLVLYRGSERLEIDFPTGQMGISISGR